MFRLKSLRDYFRAACEYKDGKLQLEKYLSTAIKI